MPGYNVWWIFISICTVRPECLHLMEFNNEECEMPACGTFSEAGICTCIYSALASTCYLPCMHAEAIGSSWAALSSKLLICVDQWGYSGLHFICTPTHTLCQWYPYVSLNTTSLHPMDHHVPLSLHLPQSCHTLTPPTHVDVHSQYAVGGPVLVQWVPTSHFRVRVEQEVVKKPEDQQWLTHSQ